MTVDVVRRLFTADEYFQMIEAGILAADDRVELIEGEILEMPPRAPNHNASTAILNRLLVLGIRLRGFILPGGTIRLSTKSAPAPDIVVLRPHPRKYRDRYAEPEDVLLLVEVSDSSLRRDRELKLPIYARAGINEYWIVNIRDEILEVYKKPTGSAYATAEQFPRPESVTPSAFPDLHLAVDEIFA
jgi:Uma2 family endonuclease